MAPYRSFLFPEASVSGDELTLDARESHHLIRVFRAKVGGAVEVLDGSGTRYVGKLAAIDAKAARIQIESTHHDPAPRAHVTLVQSIPKGKTMDLILRMATEIGAARVQPVFTDQGDVQIKGERLRGKMDKWQVTMIEACKQCGLSRLPDLGAPVSIRDWLAEHPSSETDLRLVASLEAGSQPLVEVLAASDRRERVVVAVGPEGDFTEREYADLRAAGFRPVRLGANVLRAETAAAYMLSVVDQCL